MTSEGVRYEDHPALCVSLVEGLPAVSLPEALGRADLTEVGSRQEAEDWTFASSALNRSWLAVGETHGQVFVWEENGWIGADADLAVELSRGGSFQSMYWNVNAVMSFVLARRGVLVRQFDPLFRGQDLNAFHEVGAPLAEESGCDWRAAPRSSGVELLSRLTGLRPVSPALLGVPGVRYFGVTF